MFSKRYLHFKELDSSSAYIKRRRSFLKNLTFVSCDYQTNGRGRLSRTWHSTKGENLLFSFLIKDNALIKKVNGLSVLIGACIFKALHKLGIKNLSIKWPNDIYADGKKICGILLESFIGEINDKAVIVGVGINVNQTEFLGEYLTAPTSLKAQTGKTFNLKSIKKIVYKTIKKELSLYKKDKSDYIKVVNEHNFLYNKSVFCEINGEKTQVVVGNIDKDNTLTVIKDGKEQKVFTGEITFHI